MLYVLNFVRVMSQIFLSYDEPSNNFYVRKVTYFVGVLFLLVFYLFFRPPVLGDELYTQMDFRSIDIIIVESYEWYH